MRKLLQDSASHLTGSWIPLNGLNQLDKTYLIKHGSTQDRATPPGFGYIIVFVL